MGDDRAAPPGWQINSKFCVALLHVLPQAKLGEDWDTSSWAEQFPTDTPRQGNDCDCGVFVLMACNRLGLKGGVFDFNQQDMVNIRAAVACDLVLGRIVASAHPNSAA